MLLSESPNMSSLDDVLGDRCARWALFCFLEVTVVNSAPSLADPLEPGYLESILLGGLGERLVLLNWCREEVCD